MLAGFVPTFQATTLEPNTPDEVIAKPLLVEMEFIANIKGDLRRVGLWLRRIEQMQKKIHML